MIHLYTLCSKTIVCFSLIYHQWVSRVTETGHSFSSAVTTSPKGVSTSCAGAVNAQLAFRTGHRNECLVHKECNTSTLHLRLILQ